MLKPFRNKAVIVFCCLFGFFFTKRSLFMLVWTGWLSNSDKMIFGREECFGGVVMWVFFLLLGKCTNIRRLA